MHINKLQQFVTEQKEPDEWWVAVDNRIRDHQFPLREIIERFKGKKVAVLNSSNEQSAQPVWIPVEWDEESANDGEVEEAYLNGLTPGLKKQFGRMEGEIGSLRTEMGSILEFMKSLEGMIKDRQKIRQKLSDLETREKFMEESESKLMKKIQALEEREAMFQQKQEELKKTRGPKEKLVNFG